MTYDELLAQCRRSATTAGDFLIECESDASPLGEFSRSLATSIVEMADRLERQPRQVVVSAENVIFSSVMCNNSDMALAMAA